MEVKFSIIKGFYKMLSYDFLKKILSYEKKFLNFESY